MPDARAVQSGLLPCCQQHKRGAHLLAKRFVHLCLCLAIKDMVEAEQLRLSCSWMLQRHLCATECRSHLKENAYVVSLSACGAEAWASVHAW